MKSIKELNERLLFETEEKEDKKKDKDKDEEKDKKKESGLRSKEFRDTLQQYKGRISGTAELSVDYKELKKKLEAEVKSANWTIPNVKKVFGIVTKMIGVQPEDDD